MRTASSGSSECHIRGTDGPDDIEPWATNRPRLHCHEKCPKVVNNALRQVRVYDGLEMGYGWAKTKKPTYWWALMTS